MYVQCTLYILNRYVHCLFTGEDGSGLFEHGKKLTKVQDEKTWCICKGWGEASIKGLTPPVKASFPPALKEEGRGKVEGRIEHKGHGEYEKREKKDNDIDTKSLNEGGEKGRRKGRRKGGRMEVNDEGFRGKKDRKGRRKRSIKREKGGEKFKEEEHKKKKKRMI
jgi:hypothetical protein